MNKTDRAQLQKAVALIEEAKTILESVGEEEQAKYDNMSEGLQSTERGQRMEEVANDLADKDPVHYGQFGWTESSDLPYVWPVMERSR